MKRCGKFERFDPSPIEPLNLARNGPVDAVLARPAHPRPARELRRPVRRQPVGDDHGETCMQIFENAFFENFANFWRARSRLYQNAILQENLRLTAFFKIYKICILLHRWNLKILTKNRFEKSAIF